MSKKKVIRILNQLLIEIDAITGTKQGNNWKSKLKDVLNLYLGEKSEISKRLDKLYFTRKEVYTVPNIIGVFDENVYDDSKKQDFKDLIKNAIQYVESNGVYKNPEKRNFLASFSNVEVISGIVFAVGIMFAIGNYFGRLEKDSEVNELKSKLKEIEVQNNSH